MTEKEYKWSKVIQGIFMFLGLLLILKGYFVDITAKDVFLFVACCSIEIIEEIKQQFYKLRKNTNDLNEIGK